MGIVRHLVEMPNKFCAMLWDWMGAMAGIRTDADALVPLASWLMIASGVVAFHLLMLGVTAPYGRCDDVLARWTQAQRLLAVCVLKPRAHLSDSGNTA